MKSEENPLSEKEPARGNPVNRQGNSKTDPLNIGFKTPLKEHKNPILRGLAKASYTVWIVVMGVGITLAFIAAILLV